MTRTVQNLKVEKITIYTFDLPLVEVFTIATMSLDVAQNLLVHIETNDGVDGWGEASPFHSLTGETQAVDAAVAREIRPLLIGRNPLEIVSLTREIDSFLPHSPTIKSAIDMALWDIAAKTASLPLYRLLGGAKRPMETDLTIGIGNPDLAGEKARTIVSRGFRIIKVKLGLDAAADVRRLENIRSEVGNEVRLRIDANQGWDRIEAVQNLEAFGRFSIEFCEQPLPAHDVEGLRFVGARSPIPLMADESLFSIHDAMRLAGVDGVSYFNVKLAKAGGIGNAVRIAHIAEAADRRCMMGCMAESRLGITASAHVASTFEVFDFFDLDSFFEHAVNPIIGGVSVENGIVTLPDEPGIGAVPDPDFLSGCREIG